MKKYLSENYKKDITLKVYIVIKNESYSIRIML